MSKSEPEPIGLLARLREAVRFVDGGAVGIGDVHATAFGAGATATLNGQNYTVAVWPAQERRREAQEPAQ